MPYLGGFNITSIEWAGRNSVAVTIEHAYTSDVRFQLYQNKQLIGVTQSADEVRIFGAIPPGASAAPLGVIVVTPDEAETDYSSLLDLRPWNEYRVSWAAPVSPPADLHHFDIVSGMAAGDPFDSSNVIARVPYQPGKASYSYVLPTFPERGDWNIAVIARDDAQPLGNADATPDELTIAAIVYPVDFDAIDTAAGERRFTTNVADGELTIESTFGTVPSYP